jgi:hypothetical protein
MESIISWHNLFQKSVVAFIIYAISCITWIKSVSAQAILFDFDNAPIYTSLPISQTSGGITANSSATGQGYSIQYSNVMGFSPIGFSGRSIYPNSIYLSDLIVSFNQTLTDFSIMYACQELGCDDAATMKITAYMNGNYVGFNTRTATNPGTWPSDTLKCHFTQGFNSVVIHYQSHPPTCQDYGVIFMADNMRVTPLNTTTTLNLKAFIEGYYYGGGNMRAVYDSIYYPTVCDFVTVELHPVNSPGLIAYSTTNSLDLYGNGSFDFPGNVQGNSYYIAVHHRNALETWSANPVLFSSATVNYNFTNSITKAYGNNLSDLGDGNFAFFSGYISDVFYGVGTQDGVIESQDYADMENAVYWTYLGYAVEDITGDGVVESADYSLMENNLYYTRVVHKP